MGDQMKDVKDMVRVTEPYGGATVEERKAAMRRGMSDEDIAARNVIPTKNAGGEPLRIIAAEE